MIREICASSPVQSRRADHLPDHRDPTPRSRQQAKAAGATGWLIKPFDPRPARPDRREGAGRVSAPRSHRRRSAWRPGELLDQIEQGLLDLGHRPEDREPGRRGVPGPAHPEGLGRHVRLRRPGRLHPPLRNRVRPRPQGRGRRRPRSWSARRAGRQGPHARAGGRRRRRARTRWARRSSPGLTPPSAMVEAAGAQPRPPPPVAAGPARAAARTAGAVRFSLPPDALVNGTNPLLLLDELRDLGRVRAWSPSPTRDARASTPWSPPNAMPGLGRGPWSPTTPRSAIEDVFIFVMDDMNLDSPGHWRRSPSRPRPPKSPRQTAATPAPATPVATNGRRPPTTAARPSPPATPCASRPSAWTR